MRTVLKRGTFVSGCGAVLFGDLGGLAREGRQVLGVERDGSWNVASDHELCNGSGLRGDREGAREKQGKKGEETAVSSHAMLCRVNKTTWSTTISVFDDAGLHPRFRE